MEQIKDNMKPTKRPKKVKKLISFDPEVAKFLDDCKKHKLCMSGVVGDAMKLFYEINVK